MLFQKIDFYFFSPIFFIHLLPVTIAKNDETNKKGRKKTSDRNIAFFCFFSLAEDTNETDRMMTM